MGHGGREEWWLYLFFTLLFLLCFTMRNFFSIAIALEQIPPPTSSSPFTPYLFRRFLSPSPSPKTNTYPPGPSFPRFISTVLFPSSFLISGKV